MKVVLEKEILKSLGLYDTTISVGLDEDVQYVYTKIKNMLIQDGFIYRLPNL